MPRQPFQVEHAAELAVEEHVMDKWSCRSTRESLTLDATGLKVDEAELHLQQPHSPGNDYRLGDGPAFSGGSSASSE